MKKSSTAPETPPTEAHAPAVDTSLPPPTPRWWLFALACVLYGAWLCYLMFVAYWG